MIELRIFFRAVFIALIFSIIICANTDNQNATYLAWEDDTTNPQGEIHIFGIIPGTQVRVYEANAAGVIIDTAVPLMTHTFTVEGEPIDWRNRVGSVFGRKFLKIASTYPIIWESGNLNPGFNFDYEIGVLSINGTLRGTRFFTWMQPIGTGAGDILTVVNPGTAAVNVQMARWDGVSAYVNTVAFTVPAGGVYRFQPAPASPAGYYRLQSDFDLIVFKGITDNSDNDNWFEYGSDWISGTKIGTEIYGKFGGSDTKMTITGISAGVTSYDVYVMPYAAPNTSSAAWVLQSSGTVMQGASVNVNPAPNGGYFRVETNGGEVLVGGGATIMTHNWGDGDYVPGVNNKSPLDTDFMFSTGNNANGGGGNPVAAIVCPDPGTVVTISPAAGITVNGANPTTAEDMGIIFNELSANTTYTIHSNNPIYCFFENGTGSEKAMTLSYMAVKRPIMVEKTANVQRAHIGDTVTYHMNWNVDPSNSLPYQAYLWDTMPAEFAITSVLPSPSTQSGNYMMWDLGIRNAGDGGSVTITAVVGASAIEGNTYTNVGMAIMPDTMQFPNQSSAPVLVVPRQLEVIKSVNRITGTQGDTLTYSIFYSNTSGLGITNAVIKDTVPSGLSYVSSNPPGTFNAADNTVTWNFPFLADAASGTLNVTAYILNTAPIGSVQTNYVYSQADQTKPDFAEADITVLNSPVSLTKTAAPTTALKGDTVTFSLHYQNLTSGGAFAGDQGIQVFFQNAGTAANSSNPRIYYKIINNNNFPIDMGNIRIKYYFYNATIDQDSFIKDSWFDNSCGKDVDVLSVAAGTMGTKQWNLAHTTTFSPCIISANNTTGREIQMGYHGSGYPALNSTNDYSFMQTGTYSINPNVVVEYYINGAWMVIQGQPPGGVTVNDVVITDPVPPCVTYLGTIGAPAGSESAGNITWNIGSLAPYQAGTVQWYGVTDASCGQYVTNVAQIEATGYGPYSSNVAVVRFLPPPMSITKTASPYLNRPGDTVTYWINFMNEDSAIDQAGITPGISLRTASQSMGNTTDYKVNFRLYNNSGAVINRENFRIVYYFADNLNNWGGASVVSLQSSIGWVRYGSVSNTFTDMVPGCIGSRCWDAKMTTSMSTGTLANNDYNEIQNGFHWPSYLPAFNTDNDWSYLNTGGGGTYANNTYAVVEELVGGVWKLNWGARPDDPQPLTNVSFWDTIPADLQILTVNASGLSVNVTGNFIQSTVASMTGQQAYGITVIAQVLAGASPGIVTNTANVRPQGMNLADDEAPIEIYVYTPTPTMTVTPTVTFTETLTATPTSTMTATASITPSATETITYTPTPTASPSSTVTLTSTTTITFTSTETATPTSTVTATPTFTPTATETITFKATPSATFTSTASDSPTQTLTITPTSTMTSTPTITVTSTNSPDFTHTATPTVTLTSTMTFTDTVTMTITETDTSTSTPTFTATRTITATFTETITFTNTPSATPTFTVTNTVSASMTPTDTPTITASPTVTLTATPTVTYTATPSVTQSSTATATPSSTQTSTPTPTITMTYTRTPTPVPMPYILTIELYNEAGERVKTIVKTPFNGSIDNTELRNTGKDNSVCPADRELVIFIPDADIPGLQGSGGVAFTWNGTSDSGAEVLSGVYYVKTSIKDEYGHVFTKVTDIHVFKLQAYVKVIIFNTAGEIVRVINEGISGEFEGLNIEETAPSGKDAPPILLEYNTTGGIIQWDGRNDRGEFVTSGKYQIRIDYVKDSATVITAVKDITIMNTGADKPISGCKAYPNPVYAGNSGGVSTIAWTPHAPGGRVDVNIFTISGELVRSLNADIMQGECRWDLKTVSGKNAANGTYIAVISASGTGMKKHSETVKIVLINAVSVQSDIITN